MHQTSQKKRKNSSKKASVGKGASRAKTPHRPKKAKEAGRSSMPLVKNRVEKVALTEDNSGTYDPSPEDFPNSFLVLPFCFFMSWSVLIQHCQRSIKDLPTSKKSLSRPPKTKRCVQYRPLAGMRLCADILLLCLLLLTGIGYSRQQMQTQQIQTDMHALQTAKAVRKQLILLVAQQRIDQAQATTISQVAQFQQEVEQWGKTHLYHDSFDKHNYVLDSGYTQNGIGAFIDSDLAAAQTISDFASVAHETQNVRFNLHMLEEDYTDHTPYNQIHTSDRNMLNYYHLSSKTVILVSSVEEVMRVYQQGKLIHAFWITAGRAQRPSLPGNWSVEARQAPTIFESQDPPGSPYWFPNTPINDAILYHYGGFYLHDAPWRATFGPGTQFPHKDASGNTPYNFDGSHGCINLSKRDADWLYKHTDWTAAIVIY